MKRQVAEIGPNGCTRIVYVDEGPRTARPMGGLPRVAAYASSPVPRLNATASGSRRRRVRGVA